MRFFIPALLAILFHLSFLVFQKATPQVSRKVALKQVMLLPQDAVSPEDRRLLAWMNILDASHVIQPDVEYGFSAIFHPVDTCDIPLDLTRQFMDDDEDIVDFLPVPWQDVRSRIRELWRRPHLAMSPVNFQDYKIEFNCPAWLNEEDEVLPQLFDNPDEIRALVKQSPPPRRETVLKVTFLDSDVFPKVEVAYSCGIPSLDMAALRTFIVKSENSSISAKQRIVPYYVTVKWCLE